MTNKQYSIALTVTYVPYILIELPLNLLLRVRRYAFSSIPELIAPTQVIGPNYLLPTLMTIWGIATVVQGVVTSYDGLLACRFFLGVFEGGVFPGMILYLTNFYPRAKMTTRIATFFRFCLAFNRVLRNPRIWHHTDGRCRWACRMAVDIHPRGRVHRRLGPYELLSHASGCYGCEFLRPAERDYVANQVADSGGEKFEWREVRKAFLAPHVWILVSHSSFRVLFSMAWPCTYFPSCLVVISVLTLLFVALPVDCPELGIHCCSCTTHECTTVCSRLCIVTDECLSMRSASYPRYCCYRLQHRCIGRIHHIPHLVISKDQYGSLFLSIPGVYTSTPTLLTWNAMNSAPHVRRATAIAIGFMMLNAGGILSTWLLGSLSTAPKYVLGTRVMIAFNGGIALGSALCLG